jgi:hypothetical protein
MAFLRERQPLQPRYGFVHVRDVVVIAFAALTYTVAEGGAATITVTKTGAGAATVRYATADATATAGSDYTAASGLLTWAEGDSATKTFTVQTAADAAIEGAEYLTMTLSEPVGAMLGSPDVASLVILEAASGGGGAPTVYFDDTFTTGSGISLAASVPQVGQPWRSDFAAGDTGIGGAPPPLILSGGYAQRNLAAGVASAFEMDVYNPTPFPNRGIAIELTLRFTAVSTLSYLSMFQVATAARADALGTSGFYYYSGGIGVSRNALLNGANVGAGLTRIDFGDKSIYVQRAGSQPTTYGDLGADDVDHLFRMEYPVGGPARLLINGVAAMEADGAGYDEFLYELILEFYDESLDGAAVAGIRVARVKVESL